MKVMGADRAGFSENTNIPTYKVEDERNKLTIEEMNAYAHKPLPAMAMLTLLGTICTKIFANSLPSAAARFSTASLSRVCLSGCIYQTASSLVKHSKFINIYFEL